MKQASTLLVKDYAEAVFARARTPLGPSGYTPDWDDRPARFTVYPTATSFPLPDRTPVMSASLGEVCRSPATGQGAIGIPELSGLLKMSYGLLARRTRINWNGPAPTSHARAVYARGAASGGGLYPMEIYYVTGASGAVLPGIYHYSPADHALERLLTGDVIAQVRTALGTREGDQFLLIGCRFWKNSFKYANFCYHVVTQDVGALLETWEFGAAALGTSIASTLWFADEQLDDLVGMDGATDSVLAVATLRSARNSGERSSGSPSPTVLHRAYEQSSKVVRFKLVEQVHAATKLTRPPGLDSIKDRGEKIEAVRYGESIPLPPVPGDTPSTALDTVLRTRASSFGGFTASPTATSAELATVLSISASALRQDGDGPERLTRLALFVNRADGIARGVYDYDPDAHGLVRIPGAPADVGRFLQDNYLLTNYNLGQVNAVLAVVGRLTTALTAFGARGYRLLNAQAGRAIQAGYLAAAAIGLGAGAALGFDNLSMNEALNVSGADERSLLFLLLGKERRLHASLTMPVDQGTVA
ncbi:SagB family peptide dehydrogenase [Amycolatopsis circi]|uniref:SagB family peptide dehydrogenase n=1 Tax=Amycolatopsis circi TaxID=871959 RepID=UPI000E227594|nr:SagB family peptide dehydrogenase [Amycolatopsis circi]